MLPWCERPSRPWKAFLLVDEGCWSHPSGMLEKKTCGQRHLAIISSPPVFSQSKKKCWEAVSSPIPHKRLLKELAFKVRETLLRKRGARSWSSLGLLRWEVFRKPSSFLPLQGDHQGLRHGPSGCSYCESSSLEAWGDVLLFPLRPSPPWK